MSARFTANNFIAIMIAIILMAIGFALYFINEQSVSATNEVSAQATEPVSMSAGTGPVPDDALAEVALIHAKIGESSVSDTVTELDLLRESLDFSDAPAPEPALVKTDDYDVYIDVSKDYLVYFFDKIGYTSEQIESDETPSIPPVLVISLHQGWADDFTVQFKKSIFYRLMLSLVLFENEAVLREREALLAILAGDADYSDRQMTWMKDLAYRYRVTDEPVDAALTDAELDELLNRLDMVPPSLALAQAAHESGYASSRFARTTNALFGHWDWGSNTLKPEQQRSSMGGSGIKAFARPLDSVHSYIMNLNSRRAYADFRTERARQRGEAHGRIVLDAWKLADTLTAYSKRGAEYTEELKGTMRFNRLDRADHLRLMAGAPIYFHNP